MDGKLTVNVHALLFVISCVDAGSACVLQTLSHSSTVTPPNILEDYAKRYSILSLSASLIGISTEIMRLKPAGI